MSNFRSKFITILKSVICFISQVYIKQNLLISKHFFGQQNCMILFQPPSIPDTSLIAIVFITLTFKVLEKRGTLEHWSSLSSPFYGINAPFFIPCIDFKGEKSSGKMLPSNFQPKLQNLEKCVLRLIICCT